MRNRERKREEEGEHERERGNETRKKGRGMGEKNARRRSLLTRPAGRLAKGGGAMAGSGPEGDAFAVRREIGAGCRNIKARRGGTRSRNRKEVPERETVKKWSANSAPVQARWFRDRRQPTRRL